MSHSESVPSTSSAHRGFEVLDAEHLDARLSAIREALRLCPTEVPASLSIPAHKALDAVAQRLALGVDHTVVALFGGTGSGKSSLFNPAELRRCRRASPHDVAGRRLLLG